MTSKKATYHTTADTAESLYKDKGSKFYGYAFPITSEQVFKEHLEKIKKGHKQARHFCYAWRLDPRSQGYRANDDGEPAHTAGTPILNQIQSQNLWCIGVIVVRYFGGTKLGVPGLIQAYKQAAQDALTQVTPCEVAYTEQLSIEISYEQLNKVYYWFKIFEVTITHQKLERNCAFSISVPEENLPNLLLEFQKENINFVKK